MRIPKTRQCLLACVSIALAMVAAACSGGSDHTSVSVRKHVTTSSEASSHTSSTRRSGHASTGKSKKHASRSTTTRKGSSAHASDTGGGSVTVTTSGELSFGGTTPTSGTTHTTTPHTRGTSPPRTTTTVYDGPKPYDPSKPIDLGGEPGVTPAEQHRAEQLVRDTLRDLPKYADWHVAYNAGYRTIGDGPTGYEHFVNWSYLDDGRILDSKYPESLVYDTSNGGRKLVSAMYSLPLGSTFADVPDVGGPLTQWHVHNDLCLKDNPSDPLQKVVSSLTTVDGDCPPGSTKAGSAPMLHVWIVKNSCGPFAPLEGIGAGQVPPGQTPNCDTGHGST